MRKNIFRITIIIMIILLVFSLNSFASIKTKYYEFPEHEKYTSENYHYIIVNDYKANSYTIFFIPKDVDFYMYINSKNCIVFVNNSTKNFNIYFSDYSVDNGYVNDNYYLLYKNNEFCTSSMINTAAEGDVSIDGLKHLVYSEYDIYNGPDGFVSNSVFVKATIFSGSTETTGKVIKPNDTIYNIALNINTILSVLTLTIIIIFLYRFVKCCFGKK